jgi:vacuolar protein sorting-associated protein 45
VYNLGLSPRRTQKYTLFHTLLSHTLHLHQSKMNITISAQNYISKMISDSTSMKALLLDDFTMQLLSVLWSQSQLLNKHVYLTLLISSGDKIEKMKHLRCVCFVRPCPSSIGHLCKELKNPRYGSYFVYFTNALSKAQLERIAEADEWQLVQEVQEYFCDYIAHSPSLFSFNIPTKLNSEYSFEQVFSDSPDSWNTSSLRRCAEGLCSVMLSLKKKCAIRWEKGSNVCRRLSQEIDVCINGKD